jgi:hypothetical protein
MAGLNIADRAIDDDAPGLIRRRAHGWAAHLPVRDPPRLRQRRQVERLGAGAHRLVDQVADRVELGQARRDPVGLARYQLLHLLTP